MPSQIQDFKSAIINVRLAYNHQDGPELINKLEQRFSTFYVNAIVNLQPLQYDTFEDFADALRYGNAYNLLWLDINDQVYCLERSVTIVNYAKNWFWEWANQILMERFDRAWEQQ